MSTASVLLLAYVAGTLAFTGFCIQLTMGDKMPVLTRFVVCLLLGLLWLPTILLASVLAVFEEYKRPS